MKSRWMDVGLAVALLAPTALLAQTPPPPKAAKPPAPLARLVEGQPVESRPPEKADDKPLFPQQTRAPYHASKPFQVTVLTSGLARPWTFAFLPDGKILATEKGGTMRTLDPRGVLSDPVAGVPPVAFRGEVGLMGLALDPAFARNRRLFFTFNEAEGPAPDQDTLVVARATLSPDDKALGDVKVIFRASPALAPATSSHDQGGRVIVGRDGDLYVSLGDRSRSPPSPGAQDLSSDLGKIVRITADGAPAPGNPFIGKAGARPEIWSYGHRNPEGLAFDSHGQLWEVENGPKGGDELNRIEPGRNYGWPVIAHGVDDTGAPIGDGQTAKPGMEQPVYYWDPVIAPSGMTVYEGALFPDWKGSVFVGGLRGQQLDRLSLSNGKVVAEEPLLRDMRTRIRDVQAGPDGALYVLTDSGSLLKLTPR